MKRFRSAITGRFVTLAYALKHPCITVAETVRKLILRSPDGS